MSRIILAPEDFAQSLGYHSYEALVAASEAVVADGDVTWFVSPSPDGRWAAWDDAELAVDRVAYFPTREAAVQYHLDAARNAGIVEE